MGMNGADSEVRSYLAWVDGFATSRRGGSGMMNFLRGDLDKIGDTIFFYVLEYVALTNGFRFGDV